MPKQISLMKLRKQVVRLEKRNKELDEIKKLSEQAEQERMFLNKKLRNLKSSRKPLAQFKAKLKVLGKRSKPLALRLKKAIDRASMNQ